MRYLFFCCIAAFAICSCRQPNPAYVQAPFEELDTLATNDWWNRAENPIINLKVPRNEVVAFGIYTVANETLKLSAQLYPLYPDETRECGWK